MSDKTKTGIRIEKERREAWEAERAFIDQWMARGSVPVPGVARWCREDLYDRKGLR